MVIVRATFLLAIVFLLGACSPQGRAEVDLPVTPVIAMRPSWAVAVTPYARVRAQPEEDAEIVGHLRTGEVAEIVEIGTGTAVVDGRRDTWYEVRSGGLEGWAMGSDLMLYESQSRARNVSRALTTSATPSRGQTDAGAGP